MNIELGLFFIGACVGVVIGIIACYIWDNHYIHEILKIYDKRVKIDRSHIRDVKANYNQSIKYWRDRAEAAEKRNAAEIAKIWEIDITNNNDTEFGGF